jgi:hypothetical protein
LQVFLDVLEQKNQVQLDPTMRQLIVLTFQEPNGLISCRKFLKWIDLSRPIDLIDPDLICPRLPQPYRLIMKVFEKDIFTKAWLLILDNQSKKKTIGNNKSKKISSLQKIRSFVGSQEMDDLESAKNHLCPPTSVVDVNNTCHIQFISSYCTSASQNNFKVPFHLVILANGLFQVMKGLSSTSTTQSTTTTTTRILQEFQPFGVPTNVKIQHVSPLMIRKTCEPPDHGLYVAVTLQQEACVTNSTISSSASTPGASVVSYSSVHLYRLAMEEQSSTSSISSTTTAGTTSTTGFTFDLITVVTLPEANISILSSELAWDVSFLALVTFKKQLIVYELDSNIFDKSRWSNLNSKTTITSEPNEKKAPPTKATPAGSTAKPANKKNGATATSAAVNAATTAEAATLMIPSAPSHVLDLKEPPRISTQLDKTSSSSSVYLKFLMACTSKNTSTSRVNGLVLTNGRQLLKYSLENNPIVYNWLHLYPITGACIDSSTQFAFTAQSNGSIQVWNILDLLDHMTVAEPTEVAISSSASSFSSIEVDALIMYKQEYLASLNKSSQRIIFYELHLQERQVKVLRTLDLKSKGPYRILSIHQLTIDLPVLVVALSNGRVLLFDMRNAEALASLRVDPQSSITTNTPEVEYQVFQTNEQFFFQVVDEKNQQAFSLYEYDITQMLLACASSFESILTQRNMEKSLANVKRLFFASSSRMGMGLGLGLNVMTTAYDSTTTFKAFELFKPAQQQALYNALTKNSTTHSNNTSPKKNLGNLMQSDSNTTMKTSPSRITTRLTHSNSNATLPGTSSHTSINTASTTMNTTSPIPVKGGGREEKDLFVLPQIPEIDFHPKKISLEEKMDLFYREELPHAITIEKENRVHRRRNVSNLDRY